MNIVDDSSDVELDDGLAAGGGFEEGEVIGIVAGVFQLPDDGGGDLPGVAPFVVAAVRGALARGVG